MNMLEAWVVDVIDKRDIENSMPGYRQRFTFVGEEAAAQAWTCCSNAINAGFEAVAEKVNKKDKGHNERVRDGA